MTDKQLIVLDFEFNQGFDLDGVCEPVNPKCRFEIIQIGAVKLDKDYNILGEFNSYIKPLIYKKMHPMVKRITGITEEDLEKSPFFPEVYSKFKNFMGDTPVVGIWGNSDIRVLYRNASYYNLASAPYLVEYTDIQSLATKSLHYSAGGSIGLKNAVEMLGLDVTRPFHNALDDAYYTAEVLKAISPGKLNLKVFNSSHIKSVQPQKPKVRSIKPVKRYRRRR